MPRRRNQFQGKAPFCHDCKKTSDVHVVSTAEGGSIWLCGSCELIRLNPEAKKGRVPQGLPITGRAKKLQDEKLF